MKNTPSFTTFFVVMTAFVMHNCVSQDDIGIPPIETRESVLFSTELTGKNGGTTITFHACLNETVQFSDETSEFENYQQLFIGNKTWAADSFGQNSYFDITAYQSKDEQNVAALLIPIDFDKADSFSFKTKDNFYNGESLRIYLIDDYDTEEAEIRAATKLEITSNFKISKGNIGTFGDDFEESGIFNLAEIRSEDSQIGISGQGFIAFVYEGIGGVTTRMQLTDIVITDNENTDCIDESKSEVTEENLSEQEQKEEETQEQEEQEKEEETQEQEEQEEEEEEEEEEENNNNPNNLELFFSEYAEGSSNNKYIEIYNPNSESLQLGEYALTKVTNDPTEMGKHEHWYEFPEGAEIAAQGVYVIAHSSADPTILAKTHHNNTLSNGDDGLALVKGTEENFNTIDRIGDFNGDPGDGWSVAGIENATKDHVLIRKPSITEGNSDWTSAAGSSESDSEWTVLSIDSWENLGIHTVQ